MTERLITDIVSHLRTAYPGIVEEWERQRTESPDWGFPPFDTPRGLWWWLDSERYITQEFAGGTAKENETERALGAFCVRALEQLQAAPETPAEEDHPSPPDERDARLKALSTRIVNALADRWAVPLDHAEQTEGVDELVVSLIKGYSDQQDQDPIA